MNCFVAIDYSPWSEKARWALDVRRVPYHEELYVPMISEPILRLRLRRLTGQITVPKLFAADGRVFSDSYDIARFAEEAGQGSSIFPAGRDGEIAGWNERSEEILAASRALSVAKAFDDPAARVEAVPRFLPRLLRPIVGRVGVSYLRGKYRLAMDQERSAATVTASLRALREALGGRRYLLGEALSYADVTMAVSLQLVAPVADTFIRLGPATRRVCTHAPIVKEFADLVAWRDGLYAEHRRG